jgi:hypothetical protein
VGDVEISLPVSEVAAGAGDEEFDDGQQDEGPRLVEQSDSEPITEMFEEAGRRHRLFASPRRPA